MHGNSNVGLDQNLRLMRHLRGSNPANIDSFQLKEWYTF